MDEEYTWTRRHDNRLLTIFKSSIAVLHFRMTDVDKNILPAQELALYPSFNNKANIFGGALKSGKLTLTQTVGTAGEGGDREQEGRDWKSRKEKQGVGGGVR